MKKFLALLLALVMTMSLVTIGASAATSFTDDAKISADCEEAVEVMNAIGILGGYSDGSFRPQATLTRGAGAKMIAYAVLGQAAADKLKATYTVFKDVDDSVGLAPYIEWAAAEGIISGYGNGTFGPRDTLTEYAFGKMLLGALGYDAKKEGYTGAGWQKNVYSRAVKLGIYDGTESYGACAREDAARMLLGALESYVVVYGDAIVSGDYFWNGHRVQIQGWGGGIVKDQVIETSALLADFYGLLYNGKYSDDFNRPGHTWTYGSKVLTYMDTPVAEYKTAVTECQMSTDVGMGANWTAQYSLDGQGWNAASSTVTNTKVIHPTYTTTNVGGQGTLTQVFYLADEGAYRITEIHTWLAKVTNVRKATYDAANHLITPASTTFDVYDGNDITAATEDYAKDSYVLLSWSNKVPVTGGSVVGVKDIVPVTPVATAALTAYTTVAPGTTTVGTTYINSQHFWLNKPTSLSVLGTVYSVFVDRYGNIIGLIVPDTIYNYGIITAIAWQESYGLSAEHIEANMIGVNGAAANNMIIANGWTDAANGSGSQSTSPWSVSRNVTQNGVYYDDLYKYTTNSTTGAVTVAAIGSFLNKANLDPAKSYIESTGTWSGKVAVNDNTVYLVKTGANAYTSYTGYKNVPAMTGASVSFFDDGAYVTYAYVDATAATFTGSTCIANIYDTVADAGVLGNNNGYVMYVNGAQELLYVAGGKSLTDVGVSTAPSTYYVEKNVAGEIIKATKLNFNASDAAVGVNSTQLQAAYCDGTVIRNASDGSPVTSYGMAGAVVYVMHKTSGVTTVGTYEDAVGALNYIILDAAGLNVVATYIVRND